MGNYSYLNYNLPKVYFCEVKKTSWPHTNLQNLVLSPEKDKKGAKLALLATCVRYTDTK